MKTGEILKTTCFTSKLPFVVYMGKFSALHPDVRVWSSCGVFCFVSFFLLVPALCVLGLHKSF